MIRNYIKIALRNIQKNLTYSVINLLGLSIGLASFLLIGIWIINELSFDNYHKNADRTYRASLEFAFGGVTYKSHVSPTALLPVLQEMPEVDKGVRIYRHDFNPLSVKIGDQSFKELDLYYADSTVFEVFSFDIIKGTPEALYNPANVALSEKVANKYFGQEDPIGKTIDVKDLTYTVAAIYKNMPPNSHFHADLMLPFASHPASKVIQWGSANYGTYFTLNEGSSLETLDEKANNKLKADLGDNMTADSYMKINFIPIKDIHLYSNAESEIEPGGSITYIYIFSAIAFLVLIIACINYMNLSSARATGRAREVGVRKVMGAYKRQLFFQFVGESLFLTVTAGIIALILVQMAMPMFSNLAGFTFNLADIMDIRFIGGLIFIILFVAVISGSYPALILSSFDPQAVLKGTFAHTDKGVRLRKFLVVFQFMITVVLITGTLVIYDQLNYIQNKNLGYDKDQVIEVSYSTQIRNNFDQLVNKLKQQPGVVAVGRGSDSPVATQGGYTIKTSEMGADENMMITGLAVDENYLEVMGIELVRGRKFEENDWERLKAKQHSFVINETAQKNLLLTNEEVVGSIVELNGRRGEVIGVAKDFHFAGLQNKIEPLVMFQEHQHNKVFIKLEAGADISKNIGAIKAAWNTVLPGIPFEYTFLDEHYGALYIAEMRLGRLFFLFAILAIFIACLGLFGLVSFMAIQKSKEIGIRKVLGASVANLIGLLTKQFTLLILIAFVISIPLAWWIMDAWLNNFAYKINLGTVPFILAAVIALVIGILTVSYQSYKAAVSDPVKALKSE